MRRRYFVFVTTLCVMMLVPSVGRAAPKEGCSSASSGWELVTVEAAAEGFFDHLVPGQFSTVQEFASAISAQADKDGDGFICQREAWGFELNENSHWWRLGFELGLGEPVHTLTTRDNNANGEK